MKVLHIESGLGNQMLSYCELLALRKANPRDKIYIETIVFDIPECNDTICQWNGYELEKIFKIHESNVRELFSQEEWDGVISDVHNSRFWERNWNYPVHISNALNNHGLNLKNVRGDFEDEAQKPFMKANFIGEARSFFTTQTRIGNYLRRKLTMRNPQPDNSESIQKSLFVETDDDIFTGQRLTFKICGAGVEKIKDEIEQSFIFPSFTDTKNGDFVKTLESCNSVFIHARRGDLLSSIGWCYKYGYFKRAVSYIKKMVENPVFVFFTNPGSVDWCKENAKIFGLDLLRDKVMFVDWNTGSESFRDMQLMSYCKHGIITDSTFGWWGAYFIKNPNKITISPLAEINTTYHC